MLDPIISGENEVDHFYQMVNVLGPPPRNWTEGYIQMKKLGLFFTQKEKPDLKLAVPKASPLALDLLGRMLEYIPEKRIKAKEILRHPYFRQFECERLSKSPLMGRGRSFDTISPLRAKKPIIKSSNNHVYLPTQENDSRLSQIGISVLETSPRLGRQVTPILKSQIQSEKQSKQQPSSFKSPPNVSHNPLKINMSGLIRQKSEARNMVSVKQWNPDSANGGNSYIFSSELRSYLN